MFERSEDQEEESQAVKTDLGFEIEAELTKTEFKEFLTEISASKY